MLDLFIQPNLSFEKVSAAEVALPDDPNAWPQQIQQELYKQVPYIADFEPQIIMDRVDGERGYGFGHVEVTNKTEIQHGATQEGLEAAGVHLVRIPVIVNNRKLQPFDVLVTPDSQAMLPLTESRLRQAIFRPQNFDITGRSPGDMSMIGQLYPPYRQNYGFGGGGAVMTVGMGKEGASRAPCASALRACLVSVDPHAYEHTLEQLADPQTQAAILKNAAALGSLEALATCHPSDDTKTAAAALDDLRPSVLQLRRDVDGYTVKHAHHRCWAPTTARYGRGDAIHTFGEKLVLAADLSGSATLATEEGVEAPPEDCAPAEHITRFGLYKVHDVEGRELVGYVFPNLLDVDGAELPLALFTNGSQAAVQGEIVGTAVGDAQPMLEGRPRGRGCFYDDSSDEPKATIPLTIHAGLGGVEGVQLLAETFDGRQVQVDIQPNLDRVVAGDSGTMLVPDGWKWLSLDQADAVVLESAAGVAEKKAQALRPLASVVIRANQCEQFSFDGIPVMKLAADERSFLSTDDALFLLAGLGVSARYGAEKLAEALGGARPVEVKVARHILPAAQALEQAAKTAEARPLPFAPMSLLKEAAVIPDPVAVDTVLSLGFITPENAATFVSYLPQLEEAQRRMCELLVASRLGLREVPTSALEKAVQATEQAIEGLKVLAFQAN